MLKTEKSMKTLNISIESRLLLFTVGQSLVVLWRHANTYSYVILTDCPRNVSYRDTCVFRRRQVDYQSLMIE